MNRLNITHEVNTSNIFKSFMIFMVKINDIFWNQHPLIELRNFSYYHEGHEDNEGKCFVDCVEAGIKKLCFMNRLNITHEVNTSNIFKSFMIFMVKINDIFWNQYPLIELRNFSYYHEGHEDNEGKCFVDCV